MSTFKYRAKANSGNTIEGVVEALNTDEALDKISQLGYIPVRIEESQEKAKPKTSSSIQTTNAAGVSTGRINTRDITAFGRQLASLIRAGVPILRAVTLIGEQSQSIHFKGLMSNIHEDLKNGAPLSTALSKFPRLFPPLYIALISAGEASGNLDQVLTKITNHRQKQEEIMSRIRSAMVYPALMGLTGLGTIIFMLTFVMPRLMGIFSRLGGDLPLPTRILIQISSGLRQGWLWLVLAIVVILAAAALKGKSKGKSKFMSAVELRIPLVGSLSMKAEIARFGRTLELLLKSSITVVQALEVVIPVLSNQILKFEFMRAVKEVKEGGTLGGCLKKSKRFPPFMTNLLVVGEEAGKLDEALGEIADFYERETDEALRIMTALLEPLMILVMGLVVGFIVIAMLLPMFELNMMIK
ncbi:MAG: type II secretion system F family protein [Candidatus Omnitrophica bacterium]|nr:type II secretion system F family protein [Candidatus Omnitrophota bacterium]